MVDQPFRIGDRIEILDLDTWGDVVDIGLRSTRVRMRDNRTVIVPNSIIGKSLLVNHSYPDLVYRIEINMPIAHRTDLEFARQILINAVRTVDQVMPDRPVDALFLQFGNCGLIFWVRWWIESYIDTRRIFDSVNTSIYNALNQAGIDIPNPQRDIWHKIDHRTPYRSAASSAMTGPAHSRLLFDAALPFVSASLARQQGWQITCGLLRTIHYE